MVAETPPDNSNCIFINHLQNLPHQRGHKDEGDFVDIQYDVSRRSRENTGVKVSKSQISHFKTTHFYLCLVRRPHVQSLDRVTDGHVAVHAHHRQGEGAGEHVVVVDRHDSLAQSVPKRPEAQENISALKKKRNIKIDDIIENTTSKRNRESARIRLWTMSSSVNEEETILLTGAENC